MLDVLNVLMEVLRPLIIQKTLIEYQHPMEPPTSWSSVTAERVATDMTTGLPVSNNGHFDSAHPA